MSAKWKIENLEVLKDVEGKKDVVKTVHWRAILEYTVNGSAKSTDAYGSVLLPSVDPASFTEFKSLTEAQVVGWVKAQLDAQKIGSVDQIESNLAAVAAKETSKESSIVPPPWGAK